MNSKFDELTKGVAQSVTRRAALKKFGVGLAGIALACLGLAKKARGATYIGYCQAWVNPYGKSKLQGVRKFYLTGACIAVDPATRTCFSAATSACPVGEQLGGAQTTPCGGHWKTAFPCSFSL